MKKSKLALWIMVPALILACKNNNTEGDAEKVSEKEIVVEKKEEASPVKDVVQVTVQMEAKSESGAMGMIMFTQVASVVKMEGKIGNLSEGTHAIHLHEKADCSSADGKSSGGHWNPTFQDHGAWGAESGFHLGDIGNFEVDAEGVGKIQFSTDLWCIGCGDEKRDILGKAVIVHQGTDDLSSQPSGAAGARIACGGVIGK